MTPGSFSVAAFQETARTRACGLPALLRDVQCWLYENVLLECAQLTEQSRPHWMAAVLIPCSPSVCVACRCDIYFDIVGEDVGVLSLVLPVVVLHWYTAMQRRVPGDDCFWRCQPILKLLNVRSVQSG